MTASGVFYIIKSFYFNQKVSSALLIHSAGLKLHYKMWQLHGGVDSWVWVGSSFTFFVNDFS